MSDFSFKRRRFLQLSGCAACITLLPGCLIRVDSTPTEITWLSADEIKAATRVPSFSDRDFAVEDFGAVGDGETDCSMAIAAAIKACSESGGGRVLLAAGVYRTGPVHLLSNVNLHVAENAEISFYNDPDRYLPAVFTRWEGMEMMGLSPLIYAYQQSNVAVTGGGKLNGNADEQHWWPWKGNHSSRHWDLIEGEDQKTARDELFRQAEAGVPVAQRSFAQGSFLRPAFVQFYECDQVLVEDVTITAAPFWLIHPVLSKDVTVRRVTCNSHGPNSDGCDPESCNRVVIEDCIFDTGDDCIAIKSGRNNDGRRINVPCENILIQNCTMRAGHGGVVMGSEISGGVRNLHARDCFMNSPDLERALRIKTNAARGGVIEHVRYSNIRVGEVQDAIVVNFYYEEGEQGDWQPIVADVEISDFYVQKAERVFMLRGFADNPVRGISLRNCVIENADGLGIIENVSNLQVENVMINGAPFSP